MTRIHVDIDDDLVENAMRRYGLSTKQEAVDLALRRLVDTPVTKELTPVTKEFLLSLQGIGWEGNLDEDEHDPIELLDDLTDAQIEGQDTMLKEPTERQ